MAASVPVAGSRARKGCFADLEDTPMFKQKASELETGADSLRERMSSLLKGSRKYSEAMGEAAQAQRAFCLTLRDFCGSVMDEASMDIGGGILVRYVSAFDEMADFYDLLQSQINLLMVDQLNGLLVGPLRSLSETRKRMDKHGAEYDSARKKFLSLQSNSSPDAINHFENLLHQARKAYDLERFNHARSLLAIQHTKRSFFVDNTSKMMDAHMRFYKQGHELCRSMGPYIEESIMQAEQWMNLGEEDLTHFDTDIANYLDSFAVARNGTALNTQSSGESGETEQPILADAGVHGSLPLKPHHQKSSSFGSSSSFGAGSAGGPMQMSCMQSQVAQEIEHLMKAHREAGKVAILRQGYLLKRSSSLRADWKRRFFILDSRGILFYYSRNFGGKGVPSSQGMQGMQGIEGASHMGVPLQTVDLMTSTVKMDSDDDKMLRFCFRLVSPTRTYTLQAESESDRAAWVGAIQGVIASLLNAVALDPSGPSSPSSSSRGISVEDKLYLDSTELADDEQRYLRMTNSGLSSSGGGLADTQNDIIHILRAVHGNDTCADCGAPMPEWASLNLFITLCIECSGIHRQLGVHVSKVRSMTLDVKAWEDTVIELFKSTGNTFVNGLFEKRLQDSLKRDESWVWNAEDDDEGDAATGNDKETVGSPLAITRKPCPHDPLRVKEEYIVAKYVRRAFAAHKGKPQGDESQTMSELFWRSVLSADYRSIFLALARGADPNGTYEDKLATQVFRAREKQAHSAAEAISGAAVKSPSKVRQADEASVSCRVTALHIMSELKDLSMLELLVLHHANVDAVDAGGRTPLHYCILAQWDEGAKLLLRRGAVVKGKKARDEYGLTALEMAMGRGHLTDQDLVTLLGE